MLKVLVPNTITDAKLVSTPVSEPSAQDKAGIAAWSSSAAYAEGMYAYYNHVVYKCTSSHQSCVSKEATVTVTIASPAVVTWTGHGLAAGSAVSLTTSGALPSGLSSNTTYYVLSPTTDTFTLSTTAFGTAVTTTGTQTGTHKAYTDDTQPDVSVTNGGLYWSKFGPTNRWAMFDTRVNTATTYTTSIGTPNLVVETTPGVCNGAAVLDISGAASVTVAMVNGAETVFTQTQDLDNSFISDWYEYFFEPFDIKTDLLFGPMPPYPSGHVTLTVTPSVANGTVSVGAAMFGNTVELGLLTYGATAGITDYSRKETDEFGNTVFVERGYAKKANYTLEVDNSQLRRVFSTLAALRATPAVYIGSDDYSLTPLTVFGWVNDFSVNVQYADQASVSVDIKGLL